MGNQKHPVPFFLWDTVMLLPENNNAQKLYKTKCMIKKFKPIMNTKETKSLPKNLETSMCRTE